MSRRLSTLALTLGVLAVGLGLMEAGVRWLAPQQLVRAYVVPDAALGTRLAANADFLDTYGVYPKPWRVRTNASGLRMDEAVDRAPGRARVMAYGDSFAFGWGVEASEGFVGLLDAATEAQILNAGVGAYSTGHVAKLLPRHVEAFDPIAAIYFLNSNDVVDNMVRDINYRVTDYRIGDDGAVTLTDVPVYPPLKRFLLTRTPYSWLNRHSHLFVLVKELLKGNLGRPADGRAAVRPAVDAGRLGLDLSEARRTRMVAVTRAHLDRLAARAEAAGVPLLVVWIPAIEDIDAARRATPLATLFAEVRAAAAEVADRHPGTDFIDTTTRFDPIDAPALHFADGHFNRAGNAWFADLAKAPVTEWIRRVGGP